MKIPRIRLLLVAGVLAAFALLVSGCVEFLSQTLTFRYDAKTDALLIHQQYAGIYGGQDKASKLDAKEQAELCSVVADERTFFFSNWILELGVGNLRRVAASTKVDSSTPAGELVADRDQAELAGLLADNLRVSSGPFYRDASGRLCAVQRVRLGHFSQVLAQVNVVLRSAAKAAARDANQTPAARALLLKLSEPGCELFVAGSGQIGLRVPECTAEFDAFRASLSENQAKEFAQAEATFAEWGGQRETKAGMTVWTLGRAENSRTSLSREVFQGPYAPNAEAFVQEQFGVASAFDPAADLRAFLEVAPDPASAAPAKPATP